MRKENLKKVKNKDVEAKTKIVESANEKEIEEKVSKEKLKAEKVKTKEEKIIDKKAAKNAKKAAKIEAKANKAKTHAGPKIAFIATAIVIVIVLGLIGYVMNTIIKKQNFTVQDPVATIEIKDYGTITAVLYPEYAPNTVANFITLANNGFYNGLTFHRVIEDFMIQGGDPNGDGSGSAKLSNLGEESTDAYAIEGEFILNGFNQNTLRHKRGVISMARSDYSSYSSSLTKKGYDSGSCQFFIMTKDTTSLDGSYAAFGEVTSGMDIVDKISALEVETTDTSDTTKTANKPINPPVITSISVETYGVDYGKPTTVTPFDYYSYMMQQYYGSSSY